MSQLNQKDSNFKYQQIESTEDFNIVTASCLVKISELNKFEVGIGTFVSVKAKITSGNVPMKMVHTRYGQNIGIKEDHVLENESGNISFNIWVDSKVWKTTQVIISESYS